MIIIAVIMTTKIVSLHFALFLFSSPLVQQLLAWPLTVYYDSTNHGHRDLTYHPEQPERITVCIKVLEEYQRKNSDREDQLQLVDVALLESGREIANGSDASLKKYCDLPSRMLQPITTDELMYARQILMNTHQPELVTQLEERCHLSRTQRLRDGKDPLGFVGRVDADTYVTTETFPVCLRATAAWIRAVDRVLNGSENGFGSACIALTRPPGHHATYSLQNGFCLYNFAAAAAIHAVRSKDCKRVSILDWDVHYGQGVADIVRHYPDNMRYVSIHQTPAFPYEGEKTEMKGNCLTLPMPPDTTWTCGYRSLLESALAFCCCEGWQPDLVVVCSG